MRLADLMLETVSDGNDKVQLSAKNKQSEDNKSGVKGATAFHFTYCGS